jgi:hypothetical protein
MKTTSYEISKKLEEAGFSRQPFWIWTSEQCCAPYQTNHDGFRSYDLETLLDALPTFIANKNKGENCLVIDVAFGEIYYEGDSDNDAMFITTTEENESLADVAGKIWLMLKEKGLIC